jgi:3-deoxy-D-arabino-heptulosonate 7-phosphate (DAHP) synthase class II
MMPTVGSEPDISSLGMSVRLGDQMGSLAGGIMPRLDDFTSFIHNDGESILWYQVLDPLHGNKLANDISKNARLISKPDQREWLDRESANSNDESLGQ